MIFFVLAFTLPQVNNPMFEQQGDNRLTKDTGEYTYLARVNHTLCYCSLANNNNGPAFQNKGADHSSKKYPRLYSLHRIMSFVLGVVNNNDFGPATPSISSTPLC